METVILQCKCPNPGQDAMYGRNNRVMNETKTANGQPKKYRCTCCKTVRN